MSNVTYLRIGEDEENIYYADGYWIKRKDLKLIESRPDDYIMVIDKDTKQGIPTITYHISHPKR